MKQLGANYMLKRGPPNTSNNKTEHVQNTFKNV